MNMDKAKFGELLTLASRHLAEAQKAITAQRKLLSDLIKQGEDTAKAKALLEKLAAAADAMAEHERSIQEQLQAFDDERKG